MADLPEEAVWRESVYQIENGDFLSAGGEIDPAAGKGVINAPLLALSDRTAWLKGDQTRQDGVIGALDARASQTEADVTALETWKGQIDGRFTSDLLLHHSHIARANGDEMWAGTSDSTFVTPAALAVMLSLRYFRRDDWENGPGWLKFPTGHILQWGVTQFIPGPGTVTVDFPRAFPNSCGIVVPSTISTQGSAISVLDWRSTQMTLGVSGQHGGSDGVRVTYFALGS